MSKQEPQHPQHRRLQHQQGHHHDPCNHEHCHHVDVNADNQRRLMWAMVLTGGFMLAELVGGILSGSLALLADAGHMLSDFFALALSWFAFTLGRRPANRHKTYGYDRFQVLASFVNGLTLVGIALWIFYQAISRFFEPVTVLAGPMLVIAVIGLVVNLVCFKILASGGHDNLNVRSAAMHVLGDLLGSVAAILASVIIMLTGWMAADPLLSVVAALLVLKAGWQITRQSSHILLEGSPQDNKLAVIPHQLVADIQGVVNVHHIHLWSLTQEQQILTMHVRIEESVNSSDLLLEQIHQYLDTHFDITHATIQLEVGFCPDESRIEGPGCL